MPTQKRKSDKGRAAPAGAASTSVAALVEGLWEKDNNKRYKTFLTLRSLSQSSDCVYPFWDQLEAKLSDENSYQRSIGLMLLSENVRWDKNQRFKRTIKRYLAACNDEKFITARQCLQGLVTVVQATDAYDAQIKRHLAGLAFPGKQDHQVRLLQRDADAVLHAIEAKKD